MYNHLISKEFVLLSYGSKMKMSLIGKKRVKQMYAIGALFFDLLLLDLIKFDSKDKISTRNSEVEINNDTLKMLYSLIKEQKPRTFKNWIRFFNIPSKERVSLYNSLTNGLEGNPEHKDVVVQGLRAELLESGEVSEETIALALLLKSSKALKEYFSDYEINKVKSRINDFKQQFPDKWTNINRISREIEYMDVIILSSAILV